MFGSSAFAEQTYSVIETTTGFAEIDIEVLALRGASKVFSFAPIAAPAFEPGTIHVYSVPDDNSAWTVCRDIACYTVRATPDQDAVVIRIKMVSVDQLNWPVTVDPDTNRLARAPHIYLWERGPLKVADMGCF